MMFLLHLRRIHKAALLLVILAAPTFGIVLAQDCPADYASLLQALSEICDPAAPGTACAAGNGVSLALADGTQLAPEAALPAVQLADLKSLSLQDPADIAVLRMRHPLIENQALMFLALGALELENQATPAEEVQPVTLHVKILNGINVRQSPSTQSRIVAELAGGDEVTADGRNAAGSWLRVRLDDGSLGWLAAWLVQVEGDLMTLPNYEVRLETSVQRSPMQAFRLNSQRGCGQAGSGVLLQVPKAWGALEMVINEIPVSLRGTAFIQAAEGELHIFMLDGLGWTTAVGSGMTVPAGAGLHVTSGEGTPAAVLEPYPLDALSGLPLDSLTEKITPPEPLTQEAIDAHLKGLVPERGQWRWVSDTFLSEGSCPFVPFFLLPNFGFLPAFDGSRLRLTVYLNGRENAGPWVERTAPSIYSMTEDVIGNGFGALVFYVLSPTSMEWENASVLPDGESVCIWRGHYQLIPE